MNKQVVLAERPGRGPITEKTFKKDAAPLKKPADGEVVVKTEYVSIGECYNTFQYHILGLRLVPSVNHHHT